MILVVGWDDCRWLLSQCSYSPMKAVSSAPEGGMAHQPVFPNGIIERQLLDNLECTWGYWLYDYDSPQGSPCVKSIEAGTSIAPTKAPWQIMGCPSLLNR